MSQQQSLCDEKRCGKEVDQDMCEVCVSDKVGQAFDEGFNDALYQAYCIVESKINIAETLAQIQSLKK